MTETLVPQDRRQRRRQESIEEILDVTIDLMAEQGVAGLSLGEVARQLGIRPPSLYVYFASKNALYDAVFARGARSILACITEANARAVEEPALEATLTVISRAFIGWAIRNPIYSQMLFWRPVPGFEPSPEAYEPAVALVELCTHAFADLQTKGWLRLDIDPADILRDWTILIAGVVSQQLSNAPDETVENGRFTAALPTIVAMFAAHYAAPTETRTTTKRKTGKPTSATPKGVRNAHQR